jgi:hypothetical protein
MHYERLENSVFKSDSILFNDMYLLQMIAFAIPLAYSSKMRAGLFEIDVEDMDEKIFLMIGLISAEYFPNDSGTDYSKYTECFRSFSSISEQVLNLHLKKYSLVISSEDTLHFQQTKTCMYQVWVCRLHVAARYK